MKNTERFTGRVEYYQRYRPHYPKEILPFLQQAIAFDSKWIIADIGSGTGLLSELFVANGNQIYAVEPNQEMRQAAELNFKNKVNFVSVNGTAENTTLPSNQINLVTAAQAFHWFDRQAFKQECKRITAPQAYLVLIWNERDLTSPFQHDYEQLLLKFAPNYEPVCQRQIDETAIKQFFAPQTSINYSFSNSQFFDFDGLKGRFLSSSYAPHEAHMQDQSLLVSLKKLFDLYSSNNKIEFKHQCKIYCGKIN